MSKQAVDSDRSNAEKIHRSRSLKRRIYIAIFGKFDPYPPISKKFNLSPSEFNKYESKRIEAKLDLGKTKIENIDGWKVEAKNKLKELLNIKENLRRETWNHSHRVRLDKLV